MLFRGMVSIINGSTKIPIFKVHFYFSGHLKTLKEIGFPFANPWLLSGMPNHTCEAHGFGL